MKDKQKVYKLDKLDIRATLAALDINCRVQQYIIG